MLYGGFLGFETVSTGSIGARGTATHRFTLLIIYPGLYLALDTPLRFDQLYERCIHQAGGFRRIV